MFTSWGEETAKKFTTDEIKEKLHALEDGSYGMILRAKGMVPGFISIMYPEKAISAAVPHR